MPLCDANAGAFHFTHGEAKAPPAAQIRSGLEDGDLASGTIKMSRIR
jgi:hypothetical protein